MYPAQSVGPDSSGDAWRFTQNLLDMARRLGIPVVALHLPVLFVYQPGLLLQGSVWNIVVTIASLALGGLAISAGVEGFFHARLSLAARVASVVIGIFLVLTHGVYALVPVACFAVFWAWQVRRSKAGEAVPAGRPDC